MYICKNKKTGFEHKVTEKQRAAILASPLTNGQFLFKEISKSKLDAKKSPPKEGMTKTS